MIRQITERFESICAGVPGALTRFAAACIILAAGIVFIKLMRRLVKRAFERRKAKHPSGVRGETVQTLLTSLMNIALIFGVGLTCLSTLGVDVKNLLTVAGFSGVAIAFGCQTLVKDIVSGMFLWFEGRCNVGDIVTVAGQTGKIENVALRTTTLRATNGSLFVIPNGEIRTVINMTSDFRCAVVDVTVAHGQDYDKALEVLKAAMTNANAAYSYIDEDPVVLGYISMDRGAATCRIECRCPVDKCWELERGIRLHAMKALSEAGIKP